jgi:hypothetical protein
MAVAVPPKRAERRGGRRLRLAIAMNAYILSGYF